MVRTPFSLLNLAVATLVVCAAAVHASDPSEVDRLFSAGHWAEAVQKADQYLAAQPRDARVRFLKGLALAEQGKNVDAIAVFAKLTEDFPDLPEPYNNLAVLYSKQGQYEQARKTLEAAIRTNPSYATAYENLGDVYAKLASQAYSKALQVDTGSTSKVAPKLAMIRDLFTPKSSVVASTGTRSVSTRPATAPAISAPSTPAPSPAAARPPATVAKATAPAAPAASSPGKPSPVSAPEGGATQEARAAVLAWAQAWSRKDVEAYLAAYTPGFSAGKSRKAWEDERRARIVGKRSISVNLSDIEARAKGDTVVVQFRQNYSADALKVSSRKTLELVNVSGRWLIQKESIGS